MTDDERAIERLSTSALWYAWGQIDARLNREGFTVDHGLAFQKLYTTIAREFADGERVFRPSVLDAWTNFVRSHYLLGLSAQLTTEDLYPASKKEHH